MYSAHGSECWAEPGRFGGRRKRAIYPVSVDILVRQLHPRSFQCHHIRVSVVGLIFWSTGSRVIMIRLTLPDAFYFIPFSCRLWVKF